MRIRNNHQLTLLRRTLPRVALVGTALVGLVAVAGCGPSGEVEAEEESGCGPNAFYNDDHGHCDCEDGFTKQGVACLPEEEDGDGEVIDLDLDGATITGQSLTDNNGDGVYVLQAVAGDVVLRLEGYLGFGAPASGPASVALSGDELNYATCSVCVLVQTGCSAHDDHFHCNDTIMPASGSVEFEAIDLAGTVAGHLHEVRLRQVEIDANFQTTPTTGGDAHHVAHWDFSAALEQP